MSGNLKAGDEKNLAMNEMHELLSNEDKCTGITENEVGGARLRHIGLRMQYHEGLVFQSVVGLGLRPDCAGKLLNLPNSNLGRALKRIECSQHE